MIRTVTAAAAIYIAIGSMAHAGQTAFGFEFGKPLAAPSCDDVKTDPSGVITETTCLGSPHKVNGYPEPVRRVIFGNYILDSLRRNRRKSGRQVGICMAMAALLLLWPCFSHGSGDAQSVGRLISIAFSKSDPIGIGKARVRRVAIEASSGNVLDVELVNIFHARDYEFSGGGISAFSNCFLFCDFENRSGSDGFGHLIAGRKKESYWPCSDISLFLLPIGIATKIINVFTSSPPVSAEPHAIVWLTGSEQPALRGNRVPIVLDFESDQWTHGNWLARFWAGKFCTGSHDPWPLTVNKSVITEIALIDSASEYQTRHGRIDLYPSQRPTLRTVFLVVIGFVLLFLGFKKNHQSVETENFVDYLKFVSLFCGGALVGWALLLTR